MPSAIILCAGFGTRLRPLTDELPKPLVPVGDRTILEHAIDCLRGAGISELVVNVHHLAEVFERTVRGFAEPVRVTIETEIRGTAGGVAGARKYLSNAPVLVWNGDILVAPPLDQLLVGSEPDAYCLGVSPRAPGEGNVGLDARGQVVRLRGERFGEEASSGDYVGVISLGAGVVASLPERGCMVGDVALPRLRAGGRISSVSVTTPWTDAGDPKSLLAANLAWLRFRGLDGFVADGATVARTVQVRDSLVGAGARVIGEGLLERCVVCAGATATAPLRDAIVAPSGRVIAAHV